MIKERLHQLYQARQSVTIITLVIAIFLFVLLWVSLTSFISPHPALAGITDNTSVTNEIYYIGYGESWLRRFVWDGFSWVRQDVANVGSVSSFRARAIVIGDARNDGLNRVYVATNSIYELTWTGSSWDSQTVSASAAYWMDIGDGDNDGNQELYFGANKQVHQLTWDGASWNSVLVGNAGPNDSVQVAVGDADNNGSNEVYVHDHSTVSRFSWNGSLWVKEDIASSEQGNYGIALGDGNNDSENEFYVTNANHPMRQYQWNGSGWSASDINSYFLPTYPTIGDPDHDGSNEVYVVRDPENATGSSFQLWQHTWTGSSWSGQQITAPATRRLAIGDGDNDGNDEIFVGETHLYQVLWDGSDWASTDLGQAASNFIQTIAVGDGDNVDLGQAPVADAGGPYAVDEGGDVTLSGAVTDPDAGDSHTFEWDLDYDGVTFNVDATGASTLFDAAALDGPDSRTVALLVTDSSGFSGMDTTSVTINNVSPAIQAISVPTEPVKLDDQPVIVGVEFSDPGLLDTHDVTWDWGDNNAFTETNATSPTASDHSYAEPGAYEVQVTVTDDDGDSDDMVYQFIVIYDPAVLRFDPPLAEVPLDGEVTVDILIDNAADLYGLSIELLFQAGSVEVVDADPGAPGVQIAPGTCPLPSFVVQNSADNSLGLINYDVTSLAPASPCNGDGHVASVTFRGLSLGGSTVAFNGFLLGDTDGSEIPAEAHDGELTVVEQLGVVEGWVHLQGRANYVGSEVCAWDGEVAILCVPVDELGYFSLELLDGTYDITATMERYLDGEYPGVTCAAGSTISLNPTTLLGGDTNDDCLVNILDLSLMGGRYAQICDDPTWDPRADINDDCLVNIQDLAMGGSNYGKTCPVNWP